MKRVNRRTVQTNTPMPVAKSSAKRRGFMGSVERITRRGTKRQVWGASLYRPCGRMGRPVASRNFSSQRTNKVGELFARLLAWRPKQHNMETIETKEA